MFTRVTNPSLPSPRITVRRLHVSNRFCYPRQRNAPPTSTVELEPGDIDGLPDFGYDDIPSLGHHMLRREREYVYYMRLIEIEGPTLAALRKPFVPTKAPLRIRTISYGGEPHPAMTKAVLVAPLSGLGLNSAAALHKCKLLAGPRFSLEPPADGGVSREEHEREGKEGYIKIACEDFPIPEMNAKWCSDALDRLIAEAQWDAGKYADMPLDLRHIAAREMKKHRHDRPTIRDFPVEWLPKHLQPQAKERTE